MTLPTRGRTSLAPLALSLAGPAGLVGTAGTACLALVLSHAATAQDPPPMMGGGLTDEELQFFESKIRPIFATHCAKCHSATSERVRGGLRMDTRARMLEGGDTGPAIVPGNPDASLLIQAVRYTDEEFQMPPKERLTDAQIADLERWVRMGAPDPREEPGAAGGAVVETPASEIDLEKGRQFWSFVQPKASPPPSVKNTDWPSCDIDRFVLAGMEAKGLKPVGDADRRALIRRLSFDLLGLPPTPEEVEAFVRDDTAGAYERVVDRMLASPRFGERWGRHWLDVARFAESSGKETNIFYPHAWRYRDWVIDAFNDDMPIDQFLAQQIAGDLIDHTEPTARAEGIIATGFFAIGAKGHNTMGQVQFTADLIDEQIDALGQGMLGLTIACARCHDHRFDPIPTRDYYAVAGIFASTDTQYGTMRGPGNRHPDELIALPERAQVPNGPTMPTAVRQVLDGIRERAKGVAEATAVKDGQDAFRKATAQQQVATVDDLLVRFDEQGNATAANRVAMGLMEGRPTDMPILVRGEVNQRGDIVPRGFLSVLEGTDARPITRGSGRWELAQWVADESNPLTARVFVNRVWLHLFGAGIVPTPDNFGSSGQRPTHPELLDTLAAQFMEDGWSVKRLIKQLVLSRTYRLSSDASPANGKIDPDGTYLWRMPHRRLEGEAIRDAMLACAGTLEVEPPVGSIVGVLDGGTRDQGPAARFIASPSVKRSVYLPVVRDMVPESLAVFDFAEPSLICGDREETNVPAQALYMMNDPAVVQIAGEMARRLQRDCVKDSERLIRGFQLAYGRRPTSSETTAARSFLKDFSKAESAGASSRDELAIMGWTAFCQALFQSAEFRYLD